MNLKLLAFKKSYAYVKKLDLMKAFGRNSTTLVVKNHRNIKLIFDADHDNEATTIKTSIPQVFIISNIVKPIQLKMINSQKSDKLAIIDESQQMMLNDICGNGSADENPTQTNEKSSLIKNKILKPSNRIRLFTRGIKQKSFLDQDKCELKELAENVLTYDRYKGKSKFFFVNDKRLVFPSDYTCPDFIDINSPNDEYEDNYSIENPSIHDLYDKALDPLDQLSMKCNDEDDMEMIEEYIVDEDEEEMVD